VFVVVPDTTMPPIGTGDALPPPGPPSHVPVGVAAWDEPTLPSPRPGDEPLQSQLGRLTTAWRAMVVSTWAAAFVGYMAVWKVSEELGIATWWLGPRSDPQPLAVRLVPFVVTAAFGIVASYNVVRMPVIGLIGAVILAAIAVPDLTRATGLATVEFAIAGAVALVAAASFTGVYRSPRSNDAG
jgi:hypothetical protein